MVAALILVASMSVAFADDPTYSITISNTAENVSIIGKTYSAYKLFDTTYTGSGETDPHSYSIASTGDGAWAWNTIKGTVNAETGVYTNSTYGLTFTPTAADATVYNVTSTMTTDQARALADALQSHLPGTADGSIEATAETGNVIALEEAGYYVVYGTAKAKDDNTKELTAALALTNADPTATVNPKVEAPKLDKKITGEHKLDAAGNAATAQVGSTVSFELDSNVPDLTGYSAYTYVIHDTMSDGLTFTDPDGDATNDVVVKINNSPVAATVEIDEQELTITIPYSILSAATKGQAIVVTYSAVLNEDALDTDYEKNTAYLTYSNNPYTDTTNNTPEDTVFVIDVDINVDKVAGSATGSKLAGATFKAFKGNTEPDADAESWYKWDKEENVVTWVAKADADVFVTNDEGKFNPAVRGLEAETSGTAYGLLETEAPRGYNLLDAPVIVTLTGSYSESTANNSTVKTATVTASGATVTNGTVTLTAAQNENQPLATAQVINNSGAELPSTGGIGTTIFYIAGSILVLGAAILLITKRRMGAND